MPPKPLFFFSYQKRAPCPPKGGKMRRTLLTALVVIVFIFAILMVTASSTSGRPDDSAKAKIVHQGAEPTPPTKAEVAYTGKVKRWMRQSWIATVEANQFHKFITVVHDADVARQRAAARATVRHRTVQRAHHAPVAARFGSGACGGMLPPCYVMMRESGGSLTAQNPTSTASGKWQFLRGTWGGYGGYAEAWLAPESVQDARAAQLWAGGSGCSHWSAC